MSKQYVIEDVQEELRFLNRSKDTETTMTTEFELKLSGSISSSVSSEAWSHYMLVLSEHLSLIVNCEIMVESSSVVVTHK